MKLQSYVFIGFYLLGATLLLASAGDPDTTFNSDGVAVYDIFGLNDSVNAITLQQDGKIVAVGRTFQGPNTYGLVFRLKTDGTADQSFNGGGAVFADTMFMANAVLVQTDGKIVVGGIRSNYNDFALERFDSSGNPDTSFGENGVTFTDFDTAEEKITAMASQKDGKIIAVGYGANDEFLIARYSKDGILDASFGDGGVKSLPVDGSTSLAVTCLLIQPSGKIVVGGGVTLGGNEEFVLRRFNANGTPDDTFQFAGVNFYGHGDRIEDMVGLADGNIVVVGTSKDANAVTHATMAEFGTDGSYIRVNNPNVTSDMTGRSIALRADGQYVIGGTTGDSNVAVLQYKENLGLDTSFANNGIATIDVPGNFESANDILAQGDGAIVTGGTVSSATPDVAFVRLKGFASPLLADDFDGSSPGWNILKGNWNEINGSLGNVAGKKAIAYAPLPWSPSGVSSCSQCTILLPISIEGQGGKIIVSAWYQDKKNSLQLIISPKKSKWVLKQTAFGASLKTKLVQPMIPGTVYNLGLSYDGEDFILTVNGTLVLKQHAMSTPNGNIGFTVTHNALKIDEALIY